MSATKAWEHSQIASALAGLDALAHALEAKWGCGRLRLLVDTDLRARFDRQRDRLDETLFGDPAWNDVKPAVEAMQRGWKALDGAAEAADAQMLCPRVWETTMPDGRVLAIVPTVADAHHVIADGRSLVVWTLAEVAQLAAGCDLVNATKLQFPGATVAAVKDPTASAPFIEPLAGGDPDDELPPWED